MRPGARVSAREVLQLLLELPEDSAFVASVNASAPPAAGDSPGAAAIRGRRRWRGWTADRWLLADIRDCLAGKRSPRPSDDGGGPVSSSGRKTVDVIPI